MGAPVDEMVEKNRYHPLLRQDHANYQTYERYLKTLIIDSIPDIFLEEQKHETLVIGDKTNLVLLIHMLATYDEIDDDMLADNLERIETSWSPPTHTEMTAFVTKGEDPITQASAIQTGVFVIEKTACYPSTVNSGEQWHLSQHIQEEQ